MFKSDLELIVLITSAVLVFILNKIYKNSVNNFKKESKFSYFLQNSLQSLLNTAAIVYTFHGIAVSLVLVLTLELKGILTINYNKLFWFI